MSLMKSAAILLAAAFSILLMTGVGMADQVDAAAQQQRILDSQLKALSDVLSPELQQTLAAAQALWTASRDKQCAFQTEFSEAYAPGMSRDLDSQAAQCVASMNQQRLQELQGYLSKLMRYQSRPQQMGAVPLAPTVPQGAIRMPNGPEDQVVLREGPYFVTGKNPSGASYSGTCTITAMGDNRFRFEWKVGSSYVGTGALKGDTISVDWGTSAPAIYKVNPDGSLSGIWANGRGTEFLRPVS